MTNPGLATSKPSFKPITKEENNFSSSIVNAANPTVLIVPSQPEAGGANELTLSREPSLNPLAKLAKEKNKKIEANSKTILPRAVPLLQSTSSSNQISVEGIDVLSKVI